MSRDRREIDAAAARRAVLLDQLLGHPHDIAPAFELLNQLHREVHEIWKLLLPSRHQENEIQRILGEIEKGDHP